MGKASRRKSVRRGEVGASSPFLAAMAEPVDAETFRMMAQVYQAAASMQMPTTNPQEAKFQLTDTGETFSLTDNTLNRGMLAVTKQCREIGVKNPQAYTARLLHMQEIFDAHERFGGLMVADGEGGFDVHDSVFGAAATAKFYATTARMGFDLDDVVERAHQLAARGASESA